MTPTQGEHAQTEALLHASYLESIFVSEEMSSARACRIAKELVRLHDENQRLHAQVAALTAALGVQAEPAATVIKKGADRQWMSERHLQPLSCRPRAASRGRGQCSKTRRNRTRCR
jgi:hypothetical protein